MKKASLVLLFSLGLILIASYLYKTFLFKPPYALAINQKTVTLQEYNEVLDYVQQNILDEKEAKTWTTNLFIADQLLKEELQRQGKPPSPSDFQNYLNQKGYQRIVLPAGLKLEEEVNYLKKQFATDSTTWYSGFYLLVRIQGPLSTPIPQAEREKRAKVKIEEIRKDMLSAQSFAELDSKYAKDQELNTLNEGQGYGANFDKMSLDKPTIGSRALLELIPKLKAGEVSEVVTLPYAYAVIKITTSHPGQTSSVEQWLEQAKKQAKITSYVK